MAFFFEHLFGVIRPVAPRQWRVLICRLRNAEGWTPPMLLIATMGVLVFAQGGFGLFGDILALKLFNYASLATWFIVSSLASLAVSIDGMNNLRRYSVSGMLRPRWWFEVARISWIVLLCAGLSVPLFHFSGVLLFRVWSDFLFQCLPILFLVFVGFSTGGYIVSAVTGRRRQGRAFECVQYFYLLFGIASTVTACAIWIPVHAGWAQPVTALVCLVAASLMGILVLTVANRWKRQEIRLGEREPGA